MCDKLNQVNSFQLGITAFFRSTLTNQFNFLFCLKKKKSQVIVINKFPFIYIESEAKFCVNNLKQFTAFF